MTNQQFYGPVQINNSSGNTQNNLVMTKAEVVERVVGVLSEDDRATLKDDNVGEADKLSIIKAALELVPPAKAAAIALGLPLLALLGHVIGAL